MAHNPTTDAERNAMGSISQRGDRLHSIEGVPAARPLSRWEKRRLRIRGRVRDIREWIALKIAPWLEREPWDW